MSREIPAAFRLRETGRPRGVAERAGILLHGRDRTKQEMFDLVAALDLAGMRWLAPAADAGKWYPNRYAEPLASNEPHLSRAVERCDRVVQEAGEGGRLSPDRIALVGFSQGACLALEYALRHPGKVGALVVLTGALIGPPGTVWRPASGKSLRGLRVFLTGSDIDDWVAERSVRETARVLEALGAEVHLRIYVGRPHVVSREEIAEAREFLERIGLRLQPCP